MLVIPLLQVHIPTYEHRDYNIPEGICDWIWEKPASIHTHNSCNITAVTVEIQLDILSIAYA